jgi:hypothetical protein
MSDEQYHNMRMNGLSPSGLPIPEPEYPSSLAAPAGSTTLKALDEVCHAPESEWASKLSNAELADELIANLWADIPFRERKKAAVLEAAIDRLRKL